MTPQQALEHDWKVGEKLWVVYHKRDGAILDWMPIGVIEATVTHVEWSNPEYHSYKHVEVSLDADWPDGKVGYHNDDFVSAYVAYDNKWGEMYDHHKFCIDKFFDKKDAEKRYKSKVRGWNKKVHRLQASQKEKIEAARLAYEKLLAAGVVDANEHTIK